MTFTSEQRQALNAKLSFRHVKVRFNQGVALSYVEGWHVIAEANRIFGYDAWDRDTISPTCIWSEAQKGQFACLYTAKVRITVRAGGATIVREGIGTGTGRASTADLAHEVGLKAAETDATKRALSTFGNPFGLALYDKDKQQVTKSRWPTVLEADSAALKPPPHSNGDLQPVTELTLTVEGSATRQFDEASRFIAATLEAIQTLMSVDSLYAFWQANLESFAALKRWPDAQASDRVADIVAALKARAREVSQASEPRQLERSPDGSNSVHGALALPKEKRLRNKPHLEFVANQPCLICGRRPAQAHHLRFAQSRAMAMKVSDEFTVPLCNGHHDSLHRTGDERAWWARHGVLNPLKIAGTALGSFTNE